MEGIDACDSAPHNVSSMRQTRPSLRAGEEPLDQNRQGASKAREPTWAHSAPGESDGWTRAPRAPGWWGDCAPRAREGMAPEPATWATHNCTDVGGSGASELRGCRSTKGALEVRALVSAPSSVSPLGHRPVAGNARIMEHHTGSGCSSIQRPLLGPRSSLTRSLGWPPAPKFPVTRDPEMKQPGDAGAGSSSSI